jgi:hypothetical protein
MCELASDFKFWFVHTDLVIESIALKILSNAIKSILKWWIIRNRTLHENH